MTLELPPIILRGKQLISYYKLKRKYPVSREFLHANWGNVKRFILYALKPRCVIRQYAWRKRNRVLLMRRSRLLLFDPRLKPMIKRRKANFKAWSSNLVQYYKRMGHVTEHEETELYGEELSKQMKQQLELLKNSNRGLALIEDANKNVEIKQVEPEQMEVEVEQQAEQVELQAETEEQQAAQVAAAEEQQADTLEAEEQTEVNVASEVVTTVKDVAEEQLVAKEAEKPAEKPAEQPAEKPAEQPAEKPAVGGSNFLDMLMSKVRVKNFAKESNFSQPKATTESNTQAKTKTVAVVPTPDEAVEEDLGFDDSAHQPGMLLTPLVPQRCQTQAGNSAFVSDALDTYMKQNNLEDNEERLLEPMYQDGRVTTHSVPPHMDMPAVPDSLQRLRTVGERRLYLQRCKSQKMGIINNEANIYRELQRKQQQRKVKLHAMQQLQSLQTAMPFTRQGWQAASYVSTERDRYYYQVMRIDGEMVRLPGSQGNNVQREKQPYSSRISPSELATRCGSHCLDAQIQSQLHVLPSLSKQKQRKLNEAPLPAVFRPCPLSQKPYQRPLDDDTAALLLAGGSMAVVSMPIVQLDVQPQLGRPLDEIAKRYLQHILPHHDITREWAEFATATLMTQNPCGRRKSFTFVIPYLNDRNHILVRRVVDRSEALDDCFKSGKPLKQLQQFEFRSQLPEQPDELALQCADMLGEMINTVAISCSENAFISEDAAAAAELATLRDEHIFEPPKKRWLKQPPANKRPNRQMRLAKELKRLNATIIDAAALAKDANKPCLKDFCQLGCICESLAAPRPTREHCGHAKCVLKCRCSRADLTRVVRVETDGRGLSNEDAFNLRRQATARLAKMEKDFTSTLVLTDNETLLINETQSDKKRRCTKAPKRYEDFDDSIDDDEANRTRTAKLAKKGSPQSSNQDNQEQQQQQQVVLKEHCSVKNADIMKLKHCQVALRRLPDVANLATFCMTHQLYKCFCGGLSSEGRPVIIEKEQAELPMPSYVPQLATRAHYSFEAPEVEPVPKKQSKAKAAVKKDAEPPAKATTPRPTVIKEAAPPAEPAVINEAEPPSSKSAPRTIAPKPEGKPFAKPVKPPKQPAVKAAEEALPECVPRFERPPELDIIFSYYRSRPYQCRRVISVPKNCYLRLNRKRSTRMRQQVERAETPQTLELLERRIAGAVRYYRLELERQRQSEEQQRQQQQQPEQPKEPPEPTVILVRDDSDEGDDPCSSSSAAPAASASNARARSAEPTTDSAAKRPRLDIQVPKISACYSLAEPTEAPACAISTPSSTPSDEDWQSMDASFFRSSYNEVIRNMNTLVSKKMQDIDLALQRESKIIPAPNEEILCIIKWTNFLAAFESEYVFIWDVQLSDGSSLMAATINNVMPPVVGAVAVSNTRFATNLSKLPLMARMLVRSRRNENTDRLAVVMQGRQQYWIVRGFLRYMEGNSCTKPTPETHPILTKKINVLCTLMVKQRIRDRPPQLPAPPQQPAPQPQPLPPVPVQPPTLSSIPAIPFSIVSLPMVKPPVIIAPPIVTPIVTPTIAPKDSVMNIRSNIEVRKVNQADVSELQIPELHDEDHRWLVLNLFDDFSHVFVPAFRDMISLDRIHNVMREAVGRNKVVKLQFFKDAPYDAFVTPSSRRKIYFGPVPLDMAPPVLVLLQSVDGKMMLREVYQNAHNIPVQRQQRTMAFWVLQISKQLHFELDLGVSASL
ncbi:CG3363, partial [Drosophila busckii]